MRAKRLTELGEQPAEEKATRLQGEKEMGEKLKGVLGERLTIEKAARLQMEREMEQ